MLAPLAKFLFPNKLRVHFLKHDLQTCHILVHLISQHAVYVTHVFCASCSITSVRPWNTIPPKASDASILCLSPSSSPPAATSVCFSLVFPNVNSLEGYRGEEQIPEIFPSPVREAALSLWSCNKTHQRWAGDKARTRDILAGMHLAHMPHEFTSPTCLRSNISGRSYFQRKHAFPYILKTC